VDKAEQFGGPPGKGERKHLKKASKPTPGPEGKTKLKKRRSKIVIEAGTENLLKGDTIQLSEGKTVVAAVPRHTRKSKESKTKGMQTNSKAKSDGNVRKLKSEEKKHPQYKITQSFPKSVNNSCGEFQRGDGGEAVRQQQKDKRGIPKKRNGCKMTGSPGGGGTSINNKTSWQLKKGKI